IVGMDFLQKLLPTWASSVGLVVVIACVSDPKARCWVDPLASADVDQTIFECEQLWRWFFCFDPTRLREVGADRCACLDALHYARDVVGLHDYWDCVVAVVLLGGVHEPVDFGGEDVEL